MAHPQPRPYQTSAGWIDIRVGQGRGSGGEMLCEAFLPGGVAVWPPEVAKAGRIANDVNLAARGVIAEGTTRGEMF